MVFAVFFVPKIRQVRFWGLNYMYYDSGEFGNLVISDQPANEANEEK